jgi:hypothetical protein
VCTGGFATDLFQRPPPNAEDPIASTAHRFTVLDAFADPAGEQVAFVLSSHDPRVVERSDHLLRLDRGPPVESW